ncbi:MAG: hypothetical protein GTN89_06125 [Acidobacteria bacterium]|nr:hypothetical protein [Acidobacteriota bacterium]NIM61627.1 hypothetical protein [Acidobacteriota bacterium]NIO58891.1 hypothetical protein [Acidobacteriota bacterium]NIQ29942.1 hypothetical protein [Acidobacteriota bacterium]NIQ87435.1 hypothetical protein [Acidobacteriota bacterium]
MSLKRHPADDSIGYLRQGAELVRKMDDGLFTRSAGGTFRGGVGSQFRHCIDFYECLLHGLENDDAVDYAARSRDKRLETERAAAADRLEQIADRLAAIDVSALDRPLKVRSEKPVEGVPEWCGSTLHRELQFLMSHTVHHYALIVSLLERLGYELEPEQAGFGIAPSTLAHWNEADQLAG